jgi:hypothetical protein
MNKRISSSCNIEMGNENARIINKIIDLVVSMHAQTIRMIHNTKRGITHITHLLSENKYKTK